MIQAPLYPSARALALQQRAYAAPAGGRRGQHGNRIVRVRVKPTLGRQAAFRATRQIEEQIMGFSLSKPSFRIEFKGKWHVKPSPRRR
jgi:hypothetical protein